MLLAAGLGTRLLPLTNERPKALVPVGDRAAIAHVLVRLREAASTGMRFSRTVINTHWMPECFPRDLDGLLDEVKLVHEPSIRGTAGGIRGARSWLEPPVLVWNADCVMKPPIRELLEGIREEGLTLLVTPLPAGGGRVGLDEGGRVVRLRSERFAPEVEGGDYLGVAGLGRAALLALPETGCLVGDFALPWLRRGRPVYALRTTEPWSDIGSLPGYLEANRRWLDHCAEAGTGSFVAEGAAIAPGVELCASIVGRGAEVTGRGLVARSVIWPGATVRAPLVDAVVTTAGVVASLHVEFEGTHRFAGAVDSADHGDVPSR